MNSFPKKKNNNDQGCYENFISSFFRVCPCNNKFKKYFFYRFPRKIAQIFDRIRAIFIIWIFAQLYTIKTVDRADELASSL